MQTINHKAAKRSGQLALIILLTCAIACAIAYWSSYKDEQKEKPQLPDYGVEVPKDVGIA